MINVVIITRHQHVMVGLEMVLLGMGDVRIVGSGSSAEAARLSAETHPHVLLFDLDAHAYADVWSILKVHTTHPRIRIVVLSAAFDNTAQLALEAGADAVFEKHLSIHHLVRMLRHTAAQRAA